MSEKTYLKLMSNCLDSGIPFDKGERTGVGRKGLFGAEMRFDLSDGLFPLITTKKVPFRWVAEELLWFLSGSCNEKDLAAKGVDIWKEWASDNGNLGPVYGHQMRNFGATKAKNSDLVWRSFCVGYNPDGYDQLRGLYEDILNNPTSTRHVMSLWNPNDSDDWALAPCHMFYQVQIRNGTLNAIMYQRSCDMFLGVPFNIASYALLTRILAHATNYEPGEFVHVLGDYHVYDNHHEAIKEQLTREIYIPPKLFINSRPKKPWEYTIEDFKIVDYKSHGKLSAPVAI